MKLGEGGEAFFVFETNQAVPPDMQTSPLVSPSASPRSMASAPEPTSLQEPDYLNIADTTGQKLDVTGESILPDPRRAQSDFGMHRLCEDNDVFSRLTDVLS
jgi:phosphatidate phosphatase LPIN